MGIGTSQFRLPITLDTPLKFHVIIEPFLISGWHLPLSQCFSILSSAGSGSRCTTSVSSLGKLPSSFGEKSPEMTMRRNQQIRRITPIGFVTFCRVIMMILALSPFMKSLFWHSSSFSSFSGSSGSQNSWQDGENYFQLSKIFEVKALLSFFKICHSQLFYISIFSTCKYVNYKILLMTASEPQTSGIGSDCSSNWATTFWIWNNWFKEIHLWGIQTLVLCVQSKKDSLIINYKKASKLLENLYSMNLWL